MAATARVNIWVPTGAATFLGIGHGSLELTTEAGTPYYITWLGGASSSTSQGEGDRAIGFKKIRNRHWGNIEDNPRAFNRNNKEEIRAIEGPDALTAFTYIDDRRANVERMGVVDANGEGVEANHRIWVPCKSPTGYRTGENIWGLNAGDIETWWRALMNLAPGHPRRNYQALSTKYNCNAAVVEALRVGGLAAYAAPPKNYFFQGTATLIDWVDRANAQIVKLNELANRIFRQLKEDAVDLEQEQAIPTLEAWKRESKAGLLARRREQVEQIDRLLPLYHSAKAEDKRDEALAVLAQIQVQVYSHMANKQQSVRHHAVLALAKKVHWVIAHW